MQNSPYLLTNVGTVRRKTLIILQLKNKIW
jgi:hypothetical protein